MACFSSGVVAKSRSMTSRVPLSFSAWGMPRSRTVMVPPHVTLLPSAMSSETLRTASAAVGQ